MKPFWTLLHRGHAVLQSQMIFLLSHGYGWQRWIGPPEGQDNPSLRGIGRDLALSILMQITAETAPNKPVSVCIPYFLSLLTGLTALQKANLPSRKTDRIPNWLQGTTKKWHRGGITQVPALSRLPLRWRWRFVLLSIHSWPLTYLLLPMPMQSPVCSVFVKEGCSCFSLTYVKLQGHTFWRVRVFFTLLPEMHSCSLYFPGLLFGALGLWFYFILFHFIFFILSHF